MEALCKYKDLKLKASILRKKFNAKQQSFSKKAVFRDNRRDICKA